MAQDRSQQEALRRKIVEDSRKAAGLLPDSTDEDDDGSVKIVADQVNHAERFCETASKPRRALAWAWALFLLIGSVAAAFVIGFGATLVYFIYG
ncbi:MAG: hypothetical protein O3A46_01915 [Candidatus Poribacteria bacterium]|nr:hypothetical protein [Candidatus Poribacteria bacterium]